MAHKSTLFSPIKPLHAAAELGGEEPWPVQYLRAGGPSATAREAIAGEESLRAELQLD